LVIDGAKEEGGGQVLRSSLTLSIITGTPFRIENIRARRRRPGLLRQHLTAVQAATAVSGAQVKGASMGSDELVFQPQGVRAGEYAFSIGTAGSTSLVLQTVLPALAMADGPSVVELRGGTHNPSAPPFDFLEKTLFPLVKRMGPRVRATLHRAGFYPAGGGHATFRIEPSETLKPISLLERGPVTGRRIRALVASLPLDIGDREVAAAAESLGWDRSLGEVVRVENSFGPGNMVAVDLTSDHLTEVVTSFGEKGVSAEVVAKSAAREAQNYLDAGAPVGQHLADQLMLWVALAGKGVFRTLQPTGHSTSQLDVIAAFLGREVRCTSLGSDGWEVSLAC